MARPKMETRPIWQLSDVEFAALANAEAYALEDCRVRDLLTDASRRLVAKAIDLAETTD